MEDNINAMVYSENFDGQDRTSGDYNFCDHIPMPDVLMFATARTIRKLRKMKNISQGKAALLADISQSYLSNVEHARHMLSIPKLFSFSSGIEVHPEHCMDMFMNEVDHFRCAYMNFEENRAEYHQYNDFTEYALDNLTKDL